MTEVFRFGEEVEFRFMDEWLSGRYVGLTNFERNFCVESNGQVFLVSLAEVRRPKRVIKQMMQMWVSRKGDFFAVIQDGWQPEMDVAYRKVGEPFEMTCEVPT